MSTPTNIYILNSAWENKTSPPQSKLPHVGTDIFGHIRRDKYAKNNNCDRDKDVSEYTSDQLHKTAQLSRKLKLKWNESQSDLSECTSSTQCLVIIPEQIANPFHGCTTCTQYNVRLKIHSAEKVHRVNGYSDSVETSSVQS